MRRVRGFALVELTVVIPAVIVLILLLIPALRRAKEASRRAMCAGHLSQLGRAFAQYWSEYGAYAPPAEKGVIQFQWGKGEGWMDKLFPYLDPRANGKGSPYPQNAQSKRTEMFRCQSILRCAVDGTKYLSGYILNSRLWLDAPSGKLRIVKLKDPQKVIVLYDRNKWTGNPDDADMTDEWGNEPTAFSDQWGPGGLWYYFEGGPDFSGPHSDGYNILFADFHVTWFPQWIGQRMTRHAEQ